MKRIILIGLLLVATMLLVVGCGGAETAEDIDPEYGSEESMDETSLEEEGGASAGQATRRLITTKTMPEKSTDSANTKRCKDYQCVYKSRGELKCGSPGITNSGKSICDPTDNNYYSCPRMSDGDTHSYNGVQFVCESDQWRAMGEGASCDDSSTLSGGEVVWSTMHFYNSEESRAKAGKAPRRVACCLEGQCVNLAGNCRDAGITSSGKYYCDSQTSDWNYCKAAWEGKTITMSDGDYECDGRVWQRIAAQAQEAECAELECGQVYQKNDCFKINDVDYEYRSADDNAVRDPKAKFKNLGDGETIERFVTFNGDAGNLTLVIPLENWFFEGYPFQSASNTGVDDWDIQYVCGEEEVEVACVDSDPEDDVFVKGIVTGGRHRDGNLSIPREDSCAMVFGDDRGLLRSRYLQSAEKEGDSVLQFHCEGDNLIRSRTTFCPEGTSCKRGDGFCSAVSCTDTDPNPNPDDPLSGYGDDEVQGTVTTPDGVFNDECNQQGQVVQVECSANGELLRSSTSCADGTFCSEGVCMALCSDTDPNPTPENPLSGYGDDEVQGTVTTPDGVFNDECNQQGQVVQVECAEDDSLIRSSTDCTNNGLCIDGVCV